MEITLLHFPIGPEHLKHELYNEAKTNNITLNLKQREVRFRGLDPILLVATIAAGGSVLTGISALITAVLKIADRLHSDAVVLEHGEQTLRLQSNATPEQVAAAVEKFLHSNREQTSNNKKLPDSGKLYLE